MLYKIAEWIVGFAERWNTKHSILLWIGAMLSLHFFGIEGWTIFTITLVLTPLFAVAFIICRDAATMEVRPSRCLFDKQDKNLLFLILNKKLHSTFWENHYKHLRQNQPYTAMEEELIKADRARAEKLRTIYKELAELTDMAPVHSLRCFEKYRGELISNKLQDFDFLAYLYLSEGNGSPLKKYDSDHK